MVPVFLRKHLMLSLVEIGWMYKVLAIGSACVGGYYAGYLSQKYSLARVLVLFSVAQVVVILPLIGLIDHVPASLWAVGAALMADQVVAGASSTILVVLLMRLCEKEALATQYAYLSAVVSLSRIALGPLSGWMVGHVGWLAMFLVAMVLGLPAIYWSSKVTD
jgi:PAT family beta-lactamase induction signal transducer AmpG